MHVREEVVVVDLASCGDVARDELQRVHRDGGRRRLVGPQRQRQAGDERAPLVEQRVGVDRDDGGTVRASEPVVLGTSLGAPGSAAGPRRARGV